MVVTIAIVGAGFMGQTHAESYSKIGDAEVAAICDVDESKGRPLAEKTGAEYVEDFSDLLSRDIDVIDICLPTHLHRRFAVEALESGFNVFLEKPLAVSVEDGEAIEYAARKSSGLSTVGHVVRFWPGYKELADQIKSGAIGEPRHLLAYRVGPPPGWASWYMDMKRSNGVIFDLGIHDIDYVRWVMGDPKRVFSSAYVGEGVHTHGQVLLDYGHAEALCESSWMGSATFPFTTYIEVAGPGGLAHVDNRTNAYRLFGRDGEVTLDPYHEDGYVRELRHFVECVRDGRKPSIGIEDALQTLKLALAAVRSAQEGAPIQLR